MLAAVLGVYLWSIDSERGDDVVRTLTFATLVLGNLALILVNRSWRLSIWRSLRERRNRTLGSILGTACTMLILLLTIPAARSAFHPGAILWADVPVVLAAGFIGVAWFEIYKAFIRTRERTLVV